MLYYNYVTVLKLFDTLKKYSDTQFFKKKFIFIFTIYKVDTFLRVCYKIETFETENVQNFSKNRRSQALFSKNEKTEGK